MGILSRFIINNISLCGDIELTVYLPNVSIPVPLVLDIRPDDIDRSLNESVTDKIRKYRCDYNNTPPTTVSFMSVVTSTSGRLHSEFV